MKEKLWNLIFQRIQLLAEYERNSIVQETYLVVLRGAAKRT